MFDKKNDSEKIETEEDTKKQETKNKKNNNLHTHLYHYLWLLACGQGSWQCEWGVGRQLALVREFLVAIKDGTLPSSTHSAPFTFFFLLALWRFILSFLFWILYSCSVLFVLRIFYALALLRLYKLCQKSVETVCGLGEQRRGRGMGGVGCRKCRANIN